MKWLTILFLVLLLVTCRTPDYLKDNYDNFNMRHGT
jgi:hypothetical protein